MNIRVIIKKIINNKLQYFGLEIVRKNTIVAMRTGDQKKSDVDNSIGSNIGSAKINKNKLAYDEIFTLRTSMEQVLTQCKQIGFSPATVIDVGVAHGTPALYTVYNECKHLLMEPIMEYESDLKRICGIVDADYVLAAASSEAGTTSIYIGGSLDGSSIMLPPEGGKHEKREIKLVKIDDVLKDKNLQGPYLLKVDVQGAELMVLEGARNNLQLCELVILEVSFFNFRPDMPDVFDVITYMKNNGFVIYDIYGGHNRPLDGARAQTDIAFVKENGMFRKTHKWTN